MFFRNDQYFRQTFPTLATRAAIRAWTQAFPRMVLQQTRCRCAAEAQSRQSRTLPRLNLSVDFCNAVSAAYILPIAAFDLAHISNGIMVRQWTEVEDNLSVSCEVGHPDLGEFIFAGDVGSAHARRWTNRQTALSGVTPARRQVLIAIEGLYETADIDVEMQRDSLADLVIESSGSVVSADISHGAGGGIVTKAVLA